MSEKDRHYTVGYKKPPKHTQFKPGQSGNPKGKPKKRQDIKDNLSEQSNEITFAIRNDEISNSAPKNEVSSRRAERSEASPARAETLRFPQVGKRAASRREHDLERFKAPAGQRVSLKQLCIKAINGNADSAKELAEIVQKQLEEEPEDNSVRDALAALENNTDRASLLAQWRELYGHEPPRHVSRQLMVKAIAYRLQENAFGGLKPATRRFLEKASASRAAGRPMPEPPTIVAAGTRLLRVWHGVGYEVTVLGKGILFEGKKYRSLSEVARLITGTNWSGPVFFGLRKKET